MIQIFLDSRQYSVYFVGLRRRIFHLLQFTLLPSEIILNIAQKDLLLLFQSSSTCVPQLPSLRKTPCVHSEPPASALVSRGNQSLSTTPTVHPPPSSCSYIILISYQNSQLLYSKWTVNQRQQTWQTLLHQIFSADIIHWVSRLIFTSQKISPAAPWEEACQVEEIIFSHHGISFVICLALLDRLPLFLTLLSWFVLLN